MLPVPPVPYSTPYQYVRTSYRYARVVLSAPDATAPAMSKHVAHCWLYIFCQRIDGAAHADTADRQEDTSNTEHNALLYCNAPCLSRITSHHITSCYANKKDSLIFVETMQTFQAPNTKQHHCYRHSSNAWFLIGTVFISCYFPVLTTCFAAVTLTTTSSSSSYLQTSRRSQRQFHRNMLSKNDCLSSMLSATARAASRAKSTNPVLASTVLCAVLIDDNDNNNDNDRQSSAPISSTTSTSGHHSYAEIRGGQQHPQPTIITTGTAPNNSTSTSAIAFQGGGGDQQQQQEPSTQPLFSWSKLDNKIIAIALPCIANFAISPLIGAVDLFWVGRMGNALAVAGQSAANQVFNSAFWLVSFLPSVTATLVSKVFAKGDTDAVQDTVCQSLFLSAMIGVPCTAILLLRPDVVLRTVLSSNAPAMEFARPYFRIRAIGFLPSLISVLGYSAFRG